MLIDSEGNKILIEEAENYNVKVSGKSGYGKTFWCNRCIEKENDRNVPSLVVDFSGSYTENELKRAAFREDIPMKYINPYHQEVELAVGADPSFVVERVTDSLITTIELTSILQREILMSVCETIIQEQGYISFKNLYHKLQNLWKKAEETDERKNIDYLMRRIYHLKNVDTLRMVPRRPDSLRGVCVLQLSDFSDRICKFLAQFVLELIWCQIQHGKKERLQIVLDEWQRLRVSGTAIEGMLREGRRNELGLVMLSQFVSKADEGNILEQAATSLFFRPNERNVASVAKLIDPDNDKAWIPILKRLERGEAVLKGKYTINENGKTVNDPIVVRVTDGQGM